jgi:hypothetical protein
MLFSLEIRISIPRTSLEGALCHWSSNNLVKINSFIKMKIKMLSQIKMALKFEIARVILWFDL